MWRRVRCLLCDVAFRAECDPVTGDCADNCPECERLLTEARSWLEVAV